LDEEERLKNKTQSVVTDIQDELPLVVSDTKGDKSPPVVSDAYIQDEEVLETKPKPFNKPKSIAQDKKQYNIRYPTRTQKTVLNGEFTKPKKPTGGKSSRQTRRRSRKQSK
jgi:hypothetical protein